MPPPLTSPLGLDPILRVLPVGRRHEIRVAPGLLHERLQNVAEEVVLGGRQRVVPVDDVLRDRVLHNVLRLGGPERGLRSTCL